jgi:hypothetical protein
MLGARTRSQSLTACGLAPPTGESLSFVCLRPVAQRADAEGDRPTLNGQSHNGQ